jgi:hypothetical protein
VRYRGAAGGAEKAHRQAAALVETGESGDVWGLVPDPISMANAFAELGYGIMVHTRENGFRCGHFSGHALYL